MIGDYMSDDEVIDFLRLGGRRNPKEALRNLIRRHGLPVIKRGGFQWFHRPAVEAWLLEAQRSRGRKTPTLAHLARIAGKTHGSAPVSQAASRR